MANETSFAATARHSLKNDEGAKADFIENKKTRKRELKGLVACAKEFGLRSGSLVTWNTERVETLEGVKVRFWPLWKWLLTNGHAVADCD